MKYAEKRYEILIGVLLYVSLFWVNTCSAVNSILHLQILPNPDDNQQTLQPQPESTTPSESSRRSGRARSVPQQAIPFFEFTQRRPEYVNAFTETELSQIQQDFVTTIPPEIAVPDESVGELIPQTPSPTLDDRAEGKTDSIEILSEEELFNLQEGLEDALVSASFDENLKVSTHINIEHDNEFEIIESKPAVAAGSLLATSFATLLWTLFAFFPAGASAVAGASTAGASAAGAAGAIAAGAGSISATGGTSAGGASALGRIRKKMLKGITGALLFIISAAGFFGITMLAGKSLIYKGQDVPIHTRIESTGKTQTITLSFLFSEENGGGIFEEEHDVALDILQDEAYFDNNITIPHDIAFGTYHLHLSAFEGDNLYAGKRYAFLLVPKTLYTILDGLFF